jgi:hypothetical protein
VKHGAPVNGRVIYRPNLYRLIYSSGDRLAPLSGDKYDTPVMTTPPSSGDKKWPFSQVAAQQPSVEPSLQPSFCGNSKSELPRQREDDYDFASEDDYRFELACQTWAKADTIGTHWRYWRPKKHEFAYEHADQLRKLLREWPDASTSDILGMMGFTYTTHWVKRPSDYDLTVASALAAR